MVTGEASVTQITKSQFLKAIESDSEDLGTVFQPLVAASLNSVSFIQFGQTALHLAALRGNAQQVRVLLSMGADVNATDCFHRSPLHLAAANGHAEVLSQLLHASAMVDAQTSGGDTALMKACFFGHRDAVALLLSSHADPSLANGEGQTAADYAEIAQSPEVRDLLSRVVQTSA